MSHFANIETQIRDITALKAACSEMGLSVLENATARGYGENTRHGEFVIKLKGPYDIAVNKAENGTYALTTDLWCGLVEQEVGPKFGKLLQMYGVYKAQIEARKKGFMTRRQALKDGSIKLIIQGV